jgi:hypothetical protein
MTPGCSVYHRKFLSLSFAKFNTSPYPLTCTFPDRESLRHLSLCNKTLRGECRSAGLFSRLTPPEPKRYLSTDLEKLLGGIPWRLTSLGIDLGNPDVWEICAHIMGRFPDLDGIVLSRSPKKTKERFINSDITSKFEAFKGTSVTLKGRISIGDSVSSSQPFECCQFQLDSRLVHLSWKRILG